MKKYILPLLVVSSLKASVLFMGSSDDKFSCDGEEYSPTKMLKCSNVEAITDISFCYFQSTNLGCKKLHKNEKFSIVSSDDNPINFKRLLGLNKVEQTSFGIKRFGDQITKDNLIPNGTILKPKRDLIISITSENKEDSFTLYSNNKAVFKSKVKNNQVVIPESKFQYAKEYKWILDDGKNKYQGGFDILDKDSEQDMNIEIKSLTKDMNDKTTIKQIASIVYDQYCLKYDRYLILKEVYK